MQMLWVHECDPGVIFSHSKPSNRGVFCRSIRRRTELMGNLVAIQ